MIKKIATLCSLLAISLAVSSQGYWQQNVNYKMDVDLNTSTHQLQGSQVLIYSNNSPDTLRKVYYHLYFNAFQPKSMMDIRSRNISDPDGRVKDKILQLEPNEQGFQKIEVLKQNGKDLSFRAEGTILTVDLANPIAPGDTAVFEMEFFAQVPKQIRRSGRDNKEGIDYTMTQWYPKMAEYDVDGWHTQEYVGREFYGVWGSFDVSITIDSNYVIAGTGVIQNPDEVGHGYSNKMLNQERITWRFVAENVHDFGWAADPDYKHDIVEVDKDLKLHFFYQTDTLADQWLEIQPSIVKIFKTTNETFGRYPYSDFSVIQGGDGGMEYPMCTMILGHGSKKGKIGLIAHEGLHNWYYGVLGSNEYRYPWMDEGMTTYAEAYAMSKLYHKDLKESLQHEYNRYEQLLSYNIEEPMATPGDLFNYNYAYSVSSYSKGAIGQNMLRYIMGDEDFYSGMLRYFDKWKFKHPTPDDFLRVMELESGLELDWFYENWLYTIHHIDYSVNAAKSDSGAVIEISNVGDFPMPIDVTVTLNNGEVKSYYIPLRQMRGSKPTSATELPSWVWVAPMYSFTIDVDLKDIKKVEIDPNHMMADVNLLNNQYPNLEDKSKKEKTKSRKKRKKSK